VTAPPDLFGIFDKLRRQHHSALPDEFRVACRTGFDVRGFVL